MGRILSFLVAVGGLVLVVGFASQWWPVDGDPTVAEPGPHRVRVVDTRAIVPGPGLPPELPLGSANNNLDAVRANDGAVYLALRTAPHHFANPDTKILVLRSRDEVHWQLDASFALGHDLREPRLLAHAGRVVLFVSRLGDDAFAFEPDGMSRAQRDRDGRWSDLEPFGPPGAIGWRARHVAGVPALITYEGGGSAYGAGMPEMRIDLWRSADAITWRKWAADGRPLYAGGGGEADFARSASGDFFGVIRVESGDERGWGSRLCRAPGDAPTRWRCRSDVRKFDSPYVFAHDGEVYLVGRRHLRGDGRFDRGIGPETGRLRVLRTLWNHIGYSFARKRCALWRFVEEDAAADGVGLRLAYVIDLPSRGDTCFAAVLAGERPDERVVYDYSSPLTGRDVRWIEGQLGETRIYRHVLRFTRSAG